jgi:glycosyltransferase involved in cell wall biosynthesis
VIKIGLSMATSMNMKPSSIEDRPIEIETGNIRGRILVIIPAYNEAGRLGRVLTGIRHRRPEVDMLVVDDGSTDTTSQEAHEAGALVARHPFNLGYGAALQTGFKFAKQRDYDFLVQMDGDGQHDPNDLVAVLRPVLEGDSDVVIGSRFLEKSSYRSGVRRRIGNWLYSKLASLLTGNRITDSTSGYWAMNRKAVSLCASGYFPHDYPDADVLIGMHQAGISIREVPVRMNPPEGGTSMHGGLRPFYYVFKMNLSIFLALLHRRHRPN